MSRNTNDLDHRDGNAITGGMLLPSMVSKCLRAPNRRAPRRVWVVRAAILITPTTYTCIPATSTSSRIPDVYT